MACLLAAGALLVAACSGSVDTRPHEDTVPDLPTFTEGVGLSEWLPLGELSVRAPFLSVGVPAESEPVFAHDGDGTTWVL